jgi:hypothetical protein
MNPASKSIIPSSWAYSIGSTEQVDTLPDPKIRWIEKDLDVLAELRAIGLNYKECAIILPRTAQACKAAVQYHKLEERVSRKRAILISKARGVSDE